MTWHHTLILRRVRSRESRESRGLKHALVQFKAHRDLQGSHIGGHIVYFYNVRASDQESDIANVWEGGDEEMGPVTGLVC